MEMYIYVFLYICLWVIIVAFCVFFNAKVTSVYIEDSSSSFTWLPPSSLSSFTSLPPWSSSSPCHHHHHVASSLQNVAHQSARKILNPSPAPLPDAFSCPGSLLCPVNTSVLVNPCLIFHEPRLPSLLCWSHCDILLWPKYFSFTAHSFQWTNMIGVNLLLVLNVTLSFTTCQTNKIHTEKYSSFCFDVDVWIIYLGILSS